MVYFMAVLVILNVSILYLYLKNQLDVDTANNYYFMEATWYYYTNKG